MSDNIKLPPLPHWCEAGSPFAQQMEAYAREAVRLNAGAVQLKSTGWAGKRDHYNIPVFFNPYTGEPRDVRDVSSDPQGILIVPPGAQMLSASPAPEPQGVPEPVRCPEKLKPGGCQLHNLHCRWPKCNEAPAHPQPPAEPAQLHRMDGRVGRSDEGCNAS